MMGHYKISIVVPVYNEKEYLISCVDSLLAQDYADKEIWLIDDGSTDGSSEICDSFAEKYDVIHTVHKENGGLISAWKCGVNACAGEYVTFVDSNDWLDSQMLSEMSEYLTGSDKEIIASDYVIERPNGSKQYIFQKQAPGEYDRKQIEREIIPNLLGNEHRMITISRCMKLISRKLILDNQHFSDERITMGEDTTIMLPSLLQCERLVVMERKVYYHYRYVNDSMVHGYDRRLYESIVLLRKCVQNIVKETFEENPSLYEEMMLKADQEHIFMLLLALKNEARGNPDGYQKNIMDIAMDAGIKELVKNTKIEIEDKSNKLLYLCLRKPNRFFIRMLRVAMILYYSL